MKVKTQPNHPAMLAGVGGRRGGGGWDEGENSALLVASAESEGEVVTAVKLRPSDGASPLAMVDSQAWFRCD